MKRCCFFSIHTWKIPILVILLLSAHLVWGQGGWRISNPYEEVDWSRDKKYMANLHAHTTHSDGWLAPHEVVDGYHEIGYSILAITDHNAVTWPWTSFSELKPGSVAKERIKKGRMSAKRVEYENRDPNKMNMIAIQANELSQHHHMGSYFSDHNLTSTEEASLKATSEKGGLVVINHPGRYTSERGEKYTAGWYMDLLKRYTHIVGIEIYNQGDRYRNDRQLYDSILTQMMPERHVWAYSNDDLHRSRDLGRNWNVFILPELSEERVRQAMVDGRSLYVYSPFGSRSLKIPEIEKITVDQQAGTIEILASGEASVRWISGGRVVANGNIITLDSCRNLAGYVRAEISGFGNSITGSQPFGIEKE